MKTRISSEICMKNALLRGLLIFMLSLTTVFIFSCSFIAMRTKVQAVGTDHEVIYESYEIRKGDTLSSIASKYASGVNMSKGDYMYMVRTTNQISGDLIHEGCFLVIPVEKTL